jgi:parallel beta-helix repeat protein
VNGNNATTSGDFVEDTDAAPFLSTTECLFESICNPNRECIDDLLGSDRRKDPNCDTYQVDLENLMWPENIECRELDITIGQFSRMRGVVSEMLNYVSDVDLLSVSIDNITDESVFVDWEDQGSIDEYKIKYRVLGESNWVETSILNLLDRPYMLNGLLPNTTYEITVEHQLNTSCELYSNQIITTFCGNPEAIEISSDQTLTIDRIDNTISITSGASVLIENDILFGNRGKIFVSNGSRLIVNGATLTTCEGNKWKGIEIESDFLTNPGEVILKNATIENAEVGIRNATTNTVQWWPGGPFYTYTIGGGRIITEGNSIFRNCDLGIYFGPYNSPILGLIQSSRIDHTSFIDCQIGIDFISSNGVEITNSTFDNIQSDIDADASGFLLDACNFNQVVYVLSSNPTFVAPEIVNCNFIDAQLWLEHGISNQTTRVINNKFYCVDVPSDGIYMESENSALIEGNDFYDCFQGVYMSNTGVNISNNNISRNLFDFSDNSTIVTGVNDYIYLQNCFQGTLNRDIDMRFGSINNSQGDVNLEAGNCFDNFINPGLAIGGDLLSTSDKFTYFLFGDYIGNNVCQNPGDAIQGEYDIQESLANNEQICGTGNYTGGNIISSSLCSFQDCNIVSSKVDTIRAEISLILENETLEPWYKRWLVNRYKRCIDRLVKKCSKKKLEDGESDEAISILNQQPEFRYKVLAYGLFLGNLDYDGAENYINNLETENEFENDYIVAQNIYLNYLKDKENFVLGEEEQQVLYTIAMSRNTLSSAARGVYYRLTGTKLTLPRIESSNSQGRLTQTKEVLDSKTIVYPNPTNNEVFIEALAPMNSIEVLSISGDKPMKLVRLNGTLKHTINISTLPSGIYLLRVVSNDESVSTKKLIKL